MSVSIRFRWCGYCITMRTPTRRFTIASPKTTPISLSSDPIPLTCLFDLLYSYLNILSFALQRLHHRQTQTLPLRQCCAHRATGQKLHAPIPNGQSEPLMGT
jgi:hypothetical protein